MSHALGDCVIMLGIASLVFWHRKFTDEGSLTIFCALFGAIVVYFEMLTGPLPVAAGQLFPTVYLLSRFTNPPDLGIKHHFRVAAMALIAFAMGAMVTVGARILVAAVLVQPSGLDMFAGNLAHYTQPVESTAYVPGSCDPSDACFGEMMS